MKAIDILHGIACVFAMGIGIGFVVVSIISCIMLYRVGLTESSQWLLVGCYFGMAVAAYGGFVIFFTALGEVIDVYKDWRGIYSG